MPLGNYLSNDLGQGTAQGVLNLLYIIAMIPSIPPFEYCTRHAVDSFLTSFLKPEFVYKTYRWRQIILATLVYATTLGLAEIFPTETTAVVQVTSAFGVLGVSCAPFPSTQLIFSLTHQSSSAEDESAVGICHPESCMT